MKRKALITGITGQDGSYLAEFLLGKNYEVHGIIRRASNFNTQRINHLYTDRHENKAELFLHFGDLSDPIRLGNLIHQIMPDEIYHLAAQSHVRVSFDEPESTSNVTGLGTLRILEILRHIPKEIRFYQASSSEMFGGTQPPQSEVSEFYPKSPYGISKLYAHWITKNYREAYGIHATSGILFNHESPRRGETFVTRKITKAAARIKCGLQNELFLGNLDARRDWGYAPEYVVAMWLMVQRDSPSDYVISTGTDYSVSDFLEFAFSSVDLDWKNYVQLDNQYLRPTEVDSLIGDSLKAKNELGWFPNVFPQQLAQLMVEHDLNQSSQGKIDVPQFGNWI